MQEKTKKEKAEEELRKWYKDHVIHLDDDKERGKKINLTNAVMITIAKPKFPVSLKK